MREEEEEEEQGVKEEEQEMNKTLVNCTCRDLLLCIMRVFNECTLLNTSV